MRVSGIVHLLHQALGNFPVYVFSLWQPYCVRNRVSVHIHTVGVLKCRLCQSGPHGGVKCHMCFWNRRRRSNCAAHFLFMYEAYGSRTAYAIG